MRGDLDVRFDRAGYIENTISVESTQAYPYQELPAEKHLSRFAFLVLLLSVIVEEVNEIREEMRSNGGNLSSTLSKMYLSDVETFLFQMVDLIIIVTSIVLMAYWLTFVEDLDRHDDATRKSSTPRRPRHVRRQRQRPLERVSPRGGRYRRGHGAHHPRPPRHQGDRRLLRVRSSRGSTRRGPGSRRSTRSRAQSRWRSSSS